VATVLIPNCIQINYVGADEDGNELMTVLDVIAPHTLPTLADVEAARDMALHEWSFSLKDLVRTIDTMLQITATSRAELNGPQATVAVNGAGHRDASGGGVALPSGTTLSVKKAAERAGRAYRGRTYIWPFWTSDLDAVDPNQVSLTFVALVQTIYDGVFNFFEASGYPLGVASNALGQINHTSGWVVTDRKVDSMRRRLSGRGA
jgi:hypothetical protein